MSRLYNIFSKGHFRPSYTWDQRDLTEDTQGVSNHNSTEMCQSVWLPQVAHTTTPWWMAEVYATGLLTRVLDPDNRHNYERWPGSWILANPVSNQNHKVLCRAIGQGITRVRGLSSKESEFMSAVSMPPASRNTIRYSGGLQQPSNQAVIATCHALRWRQRYCQRGTRGGILYVAISVSTR